MPANEGYFDTKRDIEIINAVGFFCQACLVGKPASEISPDSRYCWFCYEFLLKEAEMDASRRGGDWKPQEADTMPAQVSQDVRTIMSTVKSNKTEVDIIKPRDASKAPGRRGPKHQPLPEDMIILLAGEGMGSKAIASRLKRELGIVVSYKTIQRLLSGERKSLALSI